MDHFENPNKIVVIVSCLFVFNSNHDMRIDSDSRIPTEISIRYLEIGTRLLSAETPRVATPS